MGKVILAGLIVIGTLNLIGCDLQPDTYNLTIQVQGEGEVQPGPGTSHYPEETAIDLRAIPAEGWQFYRWHGAVAEPFSPETTVLVDEKKTIRAIFTNNSGPTILAAPGGLITKRADGSRVDLRPLGSKDIQYIMLHAISDSAGNPTKPYQMEQIRAIFDDYSVESHYAIDRAGVIYRFVEDNRVARHAGVGSWADDPNLKNKMNRFAIGIELLGMGTTTEMADVIGSKANSKVKAKDRGFTEAQYQALDVLVQHLREQYGIPRENVITHKGYDPERKWDPGVLFDWRKIGLK